MTDLALSQETIDTMRRLEIDVELSRRILENYNAGKYDHVVPVRVAGIPQIDGKRIIDTTRSLSESFDCKKTQSRIDALGVRIDLRTVGDVQGSRIVFGTTELRRLGVLLYPLLAYGVLNGGSASSYVDTKKNRLFSPALFDICSDEFASIERVSRGKAKGVTPAFINGDGSHGPSFLDLKMRSVLIEMLRYNALTGSGKTVTIPMFQMTSVYNNEEIADAYSRFKKSPFLQSLIHETGYDITNVATGIQPMLAAFTHSSEGKPKGFFLKAYGKKNTPLSMPGGHGQNFIYLKKVYEDLYAQGKRFVYLGNIDNLGFSINPVCLALMALKGSNAGFEFAFRTRVDVKGGVLIIDQNGKLNCADIGAAISKDEITRVEAEGKKILFNVATGLFDLEYLVRNIDTIAANLPMRFADQDKDSGKYSQAEQVTWEVISIMDDPVIFGVDKYTRFLASKLLIEGLMANGVKLDHPDYPNDPVPEKSLHTIALNLASGLSRQLSTTCGLKKQGNVWVPKSTPELMGELAAAPLENLLNLG
ncbi:MAG: UTP--glucose-1-phosphate uridylyltransferase [Chitinispirillaceae bacterium]|nr:UTP--glucose-1-phosphate uridylyltransferase [Chitinispirillaceae bacterium]